jgi:hypothetical protein
MKQISNERDLRGKDVYDEIYLKVKMEMVEEDEKDDLQRDLEEMENGSEVKEGWKGRTERKKV